MRIQSAHALADRCPIAEAPEALDPYMTDPVAVRALIGIEQGRIPEPIWEYCAGTGNIVLTLRDAGYEVFASDIYDYGLPGCKIEDYRTAVPPLGTRAIITNPPFALAFEFLQRASMRSGTWHICCVPTSSKASAASPSSTAARRLVSSFLRAGCP